jgi:glutathione S-transferase
MMESQSTRDPILITFPPSLDSELARFLLEHYGIRYQERPHTMIFSSFVTLWHGWTPIFPLLYGDSLRLVGPRAISEYCDARCAPDLKLWPEDEAQKRQVERDWTDFNQTLALATARFAYYHLLPLRDLMIRPLSQGAPDFERKTVEFAYPVFAGLLRTLLWLTAKQAQESLEQVRTTFKAVEDRLATGKRFLVGDRLTLSDIAFADAAAPVVLPRAYGGPIPSFVEMPAAVQEVVNEMRARPAGAFALRIYDEQRHRDGAKVA